MYPVREMSTGTPAMVPLVTRKYLSVSMSARRSWRSSAPEVGPCTASAATVSDTSSIDTSSPDGVLHEPSQARIGGSPAIALLAQPRDRSVVDDLALLVAPRRVDHLSDGKLRRIARDEPVDELRGVAPCDDVLEERRDVDQRSGVADGVVFVLVVRFVRADGVVARPVAVVQALAQRERALVKGGTNGHAGDIESRDLRI